MDVAVVLVHTNDRCFHQNSAISLVFIKYFTSNSCLSSAASWIKLIIKWTICAMAQYYIKKKKLWCHRVLCIKTSFKFIKSIGKYSFTDTWCTGYPMIKKRTINMPWTWNWRLYSIDRIQDWTWSCMHLFSIIRLVVWFVVWNNNIAIFQTFWKEKLYF